MNEDTVKPGQLYRSAKEPARTFRVRRVDYPHPIYPGRLDKNKRYAFGDSMAPGKPKRETAIRLEDMASKSWVIIEAPATVKSGQDAAAGE